MVLSQKSLDCAHGIDRKVEFKKKKRTRKDTENVRCLILWMGQFVNLYSVKNSNVSILFPGLFALLSYDIRQKKP